MEQWGWQLRTSCQGVLFHLWSQRRGEGRGFDLKCQFLFLRIQHIQKCFKGTEQDWPCCLDRAIYTFVILLHIRLISDQYWCFSLIVENRHCLCFLSLFFFPSNSRAYQVKSQATWISHLCRKKHLCWFLCAFVFLCFLRGCVIPPALFTPRCSFTWEFVVCFLKSFQMVTVRCSLPFNDLGFLPHSAEVGLR